MKVIYKYPLYVGTQHVVMPEGAELLTAQIQQGQICLWALVDPTEPVKKRLIDVVGTGVQLPNYYSILQYIATVQQGTFVWHIFGRRAAE